jgi:hypothetical protein
LEQCAKFFVQFCGFGPEEDEAESPEGYQNQLEQKEKALFTGGEPTWLQERGTAFRACQLV